MTENGWVESAPGYADIGHELIIYKTCRLDQTFMNIDTDYKTIGLREIKVTPVTGECDFTFNWNSNGGAYNNVDCGIIFTPDNDLESILTYMGNEVNKQIEALPLPPAIPVNFRMDYDSTKFQVRMSVNDDAVANYTFFISWIGTNTQSINNFWKILNVTVDEMNILGQAPAARQLREFENVWNRRDLYVHADFANTTPYNYLGHNGEFYMTPSKLYKWTSKSNDIKFWFSLGYSINEFRITEMKPINLLWEQAVIQLQLLATVMR
jgi:hypothetical protein